MTVQWDPLTTSWVGPNRFLCTKIIDIKVRLQQAVSFASFNLLVTLNQRQKCLTLCMHACANYCFCTISLNAHVSDLMQMRLTSEQTHN